MLKNIFYFNNIYIDISKKSIYKNFLYYKLCIKKMNKKDNEK